MRAEVQGSFTDTWGRKLCAALIMDRCLFGVAFVYMLSFTSLYVQIPGLYGPMGLLPVDKTIPSQTDNEGLFNRLLSLPSLVILHDIIQLPPHLVMELCCLIGALLSLMMIIFKALRTGLFFLVLWILYLSMYKVGQTFMWFQWDILLLEVGVLTVLVALFNPRRHVDGFYTEIATWLVQWLLFRFMFAAGIVKLTSHCNTWWSLTALNYHYESQCIPTPLAWYAHQLPDWFQKLSVIGTFFIEIAVPLLFFLPFHSLQLFNFASQVFLQVAIFATGNYNFFNLLTVVLCLSLLEQQPSQVNTNDDSEKSKGWQPRFLKNYVICGISLHRYAQVAVFVTVVGYLLALTVYYFSIEVDVEMWTITSQIRFSYEGFSDALEVFTPLLALLASLIFVWKVLSTLLRCVLCKAGLAKKCWYTLWTLLLTGIAIPLFTLSLVSHGAIDRGFINNIPQSVMALDKDVDGWSLSSSYGLFRRMTGVGGRPELVIEGSNDEQDWKEYEFLYKPGDLNKAPVFVAPHQPRLDWQMWFAALGSYQYNPWLVHLVYRLLIGQKEVINLLESSPFSSPPRYIRVKLYHYHYTAYQLQLGIWNQSRQWWVREFQSDYLFSLTWDNPGLQDYLQKLNYLPEADFTSYEPHTLMNLLLYIRQLVDEYRPHWIMWAMCVTALLGTLMGSKLGC